MKTRFGHAATFGTAAAFAVMILGLLIYLTKASDALNYVSYAIGITVFSIGAKKWREQNGGFLTFGQAYMHLFLQALVYSALITIWTLIFMQVIAPGMMEDQLLIQQAKMEEQGELTQEQIDMAMSWARKFASPGMIAVFALVGNIIMYSIINLVIAAVVKKDPPPTPWNETPGAPFPNIPPQA